MSHPARRSPTLRRGKTGWIGIVERAEQWVPSFDGMTVVGGMGIGLDSATVR